MALWWLSLGIIISAAFILLDFDSTMCFHRFTCSGVVAYWGVVVSIIVWILLMLLFKIPEKLMAMRLSS